MRLTVGDGRTRMTYITRLATLGEFVEAARACGLDPLRLALAVGLAPSHLTDPDQRVPAAAFGRLLEAAATRGGGEDFGLKVADRWTLTTLGAVGLAVRSQPSARKGLEALSHYIWVQNEALSLSLEEAGDLVVARLGAEAGPQTTLFLLACLVKILRGVLGADWSPVETHLTSSPPSEGRLHRRLVGPELRFGSAFDGVVCRAADLERPPPAADPALAAQLEGELRALGARQGRGPAQRVGELIAALLPGGDCTVERVARELGVDRRTVHRRLAAEGTSFSRLLDETRRTLVAPHLERSARPLEAVAELLGFSSLSAFSRWHRQAFSETASGRRARARRAETPGSQP